MMAPKYERANMISVAIQAACHELDEPIDRVEVDGSTVVVSARGVRVVMACESRATYDPEGRPLLSGGSWSARLISASGGGSGRSGRRRLFSRLFRRS